MKLTRTRILGRYKNPQTGRPVNVHKGTRVDRSTDHLFFIRSGLRIFINDGEFYSKWTKIHRAGVSIL